MDEKKRQPGYSDLEQWLYDTGFAFPGAVKRVARMIEKSEWLAAHDRVVAANAWEQGTLALHATVSEYMPGSRPPTNPYRITEED